MVLLQPSSSKFLLEGTMRVSEAFPFVPHDHGPNRECGKHEKRFAALA